VKVFLKTGMFDPLYDDLIRKLAKVEEIKFGTDVQKPPKSASAVIKDCEIFVPLEGLIDIEVERNRLEKEIERVKGGLTGLEKKLSNQEFVSRAPAEIIERERNKKRDWEENLSKLESILADLQIRVVYSVEIM
jgi:Valyl-tRNA synthetase